MLDASHTKLHPPSFMQNTPEHTCTLCHAVELALFTISSMLGVYLQGMGTASTGQSWLLWWKASAMTPGLLTLQLCPEPSIPSSWPWSPVLL